MWRLLLHPREFTMQPPRVGCPVSWRVRRLESRVREIRTHGSEGGGAGNSTGPSYPYRAVVLPIVGRYRTRMAPLACARGSSMKARSLSRSMHDAHSLFLGPFRRRRGRRDRRAVENGSEGHSSELARRSPAAGVPNSNTLSDFAPESSLSISFPDVAVAVPFFYPSISDLSTR